MFGKRMSNNTFMLIVIPLLVLITVTAVFINYLALTWSTAISKSLGQATYRVESIDSGAQVNDVYFESLFDSEEALSGYCGELSREIAAEGMVLLKNDGGLPLKNKARISCFSVSSVDLVYGGGGSGSVNSEDAPDLKSALEEEGFAVNPVLWSFYMKKHGEGYKRAIPGWGNFSYKINEVPWRDVASAAEGSFAEYSDAAIAVISRSGGEGAELPAYGFAETQAVAGNSGNYLELTVEEKELFDALNARFGNIIVVLNANNAMELGWVENYPNIKTVLWLGAMGEYGACALADAFAGKVNPSGRLTDTYAFDANGCPAAVNAGTNFWIENYPADQKYAAQADQYLAEAEGVYVGYRYYETRYEDVVLNRPNTGDYDYSSEVAYPFGFGMSYTQFGYSDFAVKKKGGEYTVSITVKNVGDVAGKDVVQIYAQKPYTSYDEEYCVEKPSVELVGFAKTRLLQVGDEQRVSITVEKSQFAAYDYVRAKGYIVDAGEYFLAFGTDAHDAVNNILAKKGKTVADGMTAEGNSEFVWSFTENSFDAVSFKNDPVTGNTVTNRFDDAFVVGVNYLSRKDWTGTFPVPFADTVDSVTGEYYKTFPQEFISSLAPVYSYEETEINQVDGEEKFNLATLIGVSPESAAWDGFISGIEISELVNMVRTGGFGLKENAEFNIPATRYKDGPAGFSSGTSYPSEVVVAATWNTELARGLGEAVGNEALFYGVHGWFAPALNMHRTAFGGRNFEYYGEDPYMGGIMGAATVLGAQSKGLVCYVKHFALNDYEGVRTVEGKKGSNNGMATFNTEQAIREIYLKPFEYAVKEGGAKGIMNAFNRIGNLWCGHHSGLQRGVLRGEWGFGGCIITDNAGLPHYMEIKAGLQAGTNLWMNWIPNAYQISENEIDARLEGYIRESARYALYTVMGSSAMNGLSANSRIVPVMPVWQYWLIACDVAVFLIDALGILWVVFRVRRRYIYKND